MANVWDPQRQVWVDDATGNTFKPVDQGGDGVWHNAQGQSYVNGQWVGGTQQQIQPPSFAGSNGGLLPSTGNQPAGAGAFQNIPGYGYTVNQQQNQAASQLHAQDNTATSQLHSQDDAATMARQQALNSTNLQIAQLNAQKDQEVAKGNNASAERIAQLEYQVNMLNAQANQLNAQINQAAEARQERALQAQLAANPQDFVAYEYYKRALGSPTALGAASPQSSTPGGSSAAGTSYNNPAGANVQPGQAYINLDANGQPDYASWEAQNPGYKIVNGQVVSTAGASSVGPTGNTPGVSGIGGEVATPSVAPTGDMLNGGSYSPAPPAYDNNTLAGVLAGIQTPGAQQGWNPALSGQSAFGGQINPPNTLGRADYGNLSDTDKGILTSFLNAGVNMNGQQVSLDPNEYFAQMQKSWVPTLQGGTGQQTQYQE